MLKNCALIIGLASVPSGNLPTESDMIRFSEMVMVEETSVPKPQITKTNKKGSNFILW